MASSGFADDDFRKPPSYTGDLDAPPAVAMHANTPNDQYAVHTRRSSTAQDGRGVTEAGTIGQRQCIKRLTSPLNYAYPRLTCGTQAGAKLQTCWSRPPTRSSHFGLNSPQLPWTCQSSARRMKIKASLSPYANRVGGHRLNSIRSPRPQSVSASGRTWTPGSRITCSRRHQLPLLTWISFAAEDC